MLKVLIATASTLAIGFAANAQDAGPLVGDKDYLADAYSDAETGEAFSYASQWGNGRAYDGTDTSRLLRRQAPVVQTVRQATPAPIRTPVQTVTRQTYTAKTSPPYRPTQPAPAPGRQYHAHYNPACASFAGYNRHPNRVASSAPAICHRPGSACAFQPTHQSIGQPAARQSGRVFCPHESACAIRYGSPGNRRRSRL